MATTWNPSDKNANVTLSESDLTAESATASAVCVRSTLSKSWGKLYCEFLVVTGTNGAGPEIGVATSEASLSNYVGSSSLSWGFFFGMGDTTAKKQYNGNIATYGSGFGANGDRLMLAVDLNVGKIWFGKNNAWQNSGDPAAGTGEAFSSIALIPLFIIANARSSKITANFGATAFTYTLPTGFQSWDSEEGIPLAEVSKRSVTAKAMLHNRYFL